MSNQQLKIFCVTNKQVNFINKNYNFGWVGKDKVPTSYISCDSKDNIFYKEKYYSELTFHYWYWKNLLNFEDENQWIGFCQKRRFWVLPDPDVEINKDNINDYLITTPLEDWKNYQAIICKNIKISGAKKMKIIKRGWRNLIKNPSILFDKKKQNISLHFDMHHGYGNLEKAIDQLDEENREDFKNYVNKFDTFNPHIMFISKPEIINKWFESLFSWLEKF